MATVSLTMIVKNEAERIAAAVQPFRGVVDEIVVADTGSTDDTQTIATDLGAVVFDAPWEDSFSAARNAAIERASSEWILVVDADDRIAPHALEELRSLFSRLGNENVGYMLATTSTAEDGGLGARLDQVRLFPRRADLRYRYRVHEQIIPAIEASGGILERTGIELHHVGYQALDSLKGKLERNLRLVEMDCAERPGDPFPIFNRGTALAELGRHAEAIVSLTMSATSIGFAHFRGRVLAYNLARAQRAEGMLGDAIATLRAARFCSPNDCLLASLEAELSIERGDLMAAADSLRSLAWSTSFSTSEVRARALLGEIHIATGLYADALEVVLPIVSTRPGFGRAWFVLADALIALKRRLELQTVVEQLAAIPGAHTAASAILDAAQDEVVTVPFLSCKASPWVRGCTSP